MTGCVCAEHNDDQIKHLERGAISVEEQETERRDGQSVPLPSKIQGPDQKELVKESSGILVEDLVLRQEQLRKQQESLSKYMGICTRNCVSSGGFVL